jgi:FkbM family methyltransferase
LKARDGVSPTLSSGYHWRDAVLDVRCRLGRLHIGTMLAGVVPGARFAPGPSNPEYASGRNELPVQAAFAAHLRPGMVCFDIGSNVGFFSIIAARLVGPAGRVVAFEPVAANAAFIRFNARLNRLDNVAVIEKAVGPTAGVGNFFVARYAGGGALEAAGRPPDYASTRSVDVVSIDGCVSGGLLPVPQFVKIDVEGAEPQVLEGMQQTLQRHRPTVLFEVDGAEPAVVQQRYELCRQNLESNGYEVRQLEASYPDIKWVVLHAVATPVGQRHAGAQPEAPADRLKW